MADDTRTEGLKGIGADGFVRTVSNLTVTGDLVVHGETRSTIGTGSAFWETADANANYWAYELPSGGSVNVPVLGIGIGLDGVDLGLFDGVTQTTLAVLDADRDSYIAIDFSADDSPRIRSNQDITFSGNVVFSDNITVNGTTTTISSSTTVIQDPLFHLGNDNSADSVDLGIFAEYVDSGKKFSGLFRDASDSDKWKLFATSGNSHEEPTTTVNTTSGFTLANLAVNELDGTLTTAAQTNITSVGALDGGSITSNFGTIDTGSSTITTTGLITGGSLDIDNVLINGVTIGHTDDTDLITLGDGSATLAGMLIIDGNRTVTPGDGSAIHLDTHTVTDGNTSGSGTAAKFTQVNLEAPTLAATNSSVTTSDAATLYVSGAPSAGTNQTITRGWAVWVDAGNVRYDGSIYAGTTEALNSSGLVTVANQSNITGVGTITSGTWEGTTLAVDQGGTGATSLNNLITLATHTTGSYVATITGGTGIVSDAGTSGENLDHTLSIDLNEVGEVAIANGDYIAFMDATDSNATKKEALADVATLFAGTGLTASNSVIGVDAAQTQITQVGTLSTLNASSSDDIDIVSTADEKGAVYLHANGGTSESILIHSDQGTSDTEGDASVQLLSDVGGIGIKSGLNSSGAIRITADGGTSERIVLHSDQGTGSDSILLASDVGGVHIKGMDGVNYLNLVNNNDVSLGTSSGQMLLSSTYNTGAILFRTGTTTHSVMQTGKLGRDVTAHNVAGNDMTFYAGSTTAGTTNNIAGGDLILNGGQGKGSGVGGNITFNTANAGGSGSNLNALSEVARFTDNKFYIGESSDANVTTGLVINQGAADDRILTLKSSDVAQPFTALAEADTYGQFAKGGSTTGGLRVREFSEHTYFALTLLGYQADTPTTAHTTSGWPIVAADAYHTDGSTGSQAAPTNSNLFGVVSAGAAMKFIVDQEGDIFYDGSAAAYDGEDDIGLLRAVQKAVAPSQVITQEFDKFLNSNEDDLIRLGILGASRTPDEEGHYGLVCITKLAQLLTGGVVQLYGQVMERDKRIEALENRMLALGG